MKKHRTVVILVRQQKPKRTFFIDLATCIGVLSFGASAFITKEHTIDEILPAKKSHCRGMGI